MAVLTVTEVSQMGMTLINDQVVLAPKMPPVAEQSIAIGGGSVASAAFQKATRFVMLNCDIACCLAWSAAGGAAPSATTGIQRMGPNETRFACVDPTAQLAVIASPT